VHLNVILAIILNFFQIASYYWYYKSFFLLSLHLVQFHRTSYLLLSKHYTFLSNLVVVWRSWLRRWSDQRSYSTPGPVSTGMDDRIGVKLLVPEPQSNQPPRSTQPGHPSVGRLDEYRPKGGDALRLGVKADMVLFAGNTV